MGAHAHASTRAGHLGPARVLHLAACLPGLPELGAADGIERAPDDGLKVGVRVEPLGPVVGVRARALQVAALEVVADDLDDARARPGRGGDRGDGEDRGGRGEELL